MIFSLLIGDLAEKALIDEVLTTPKPGLVDSNNNGSHSDMDKETFFASAKALKPFFIRLAEYGFETCDRDENAVFASSREIGLQAEKAMFEATDGINTHKGSIFSLGLVCLSAGRLYAKHKPINAFTVGEQSKNFSGGICKNEYSSAIKRESLTHGDIVYKKYGAMGPRGEAESGFMTVREVALPFLKEKINEGLEINEARVKTLLKIMSVLEDTNVLNRAGKDGEVFVKQRSNELLDSSLEEIAKFDLQLQQRNISPGGCADMLALTLFILSLEKLDIDGENLYN